MNRQLMYRSGCAAAALTSLMLSGPARGDDWVMHLTADNQFDAYFGTDTATTFHAGFGDSWPTTYTFTATGRLPTDYLYVATTSDQSTAQGFIGDFTNTTLGATTYTGDAIWEVFAAGAHEETNPFWPNPWPASLQPTQSEVDKAIAFATDNDLWESTDTDPAGAPNGVEPWGFRPGIAAEADWIWHRAPHGPVDPLHGSYNHDEFLVFRVVGVTPAPGALSLVGLAAIGAGRRRR